MKKTLLLAFAMLFGALLTAAPSQAISSGAEYVAIGDSYSSGMGADVAKSITGINAGRVNLLAYDAATRTSTNKCYRSTNAYPQLIAAQYGLNLKFVACSGATIPQMQAGMNGEQSQLNALTTNTKLVTLTAGGNDAGFINYVQCVVLQSDCGLTNPVAVSTIDTINNVLPARYDEFLTQIKNRAPNAQIIVTGYATTLPNMIYQDPYMSSVERTAAAEIRGKLNAAIAAAAARNGVTYVDPFASGSPFNRTDASAGNVFYPSAFWAIRFEVEGISSSYHPTKTGQEYYKNIIVPTIQ